MAERSVLAGEAEYPWEFEEGEEGRTDVVRWRTLISGRRTPTRGLSMGVLEVPPGAELSPHRHRPQEVYYITDGAAEVYVGGRWRRIVRGDVVYIPGDCEHGVRNRGDEGCRLVWAFPVDSWEAVEYSFD